MKLSTKINRRLTQAMNRIAYFVGKPGVFAAAVGLIVVWFIARLFIEYDTWFDIMDVSIFIVTFLLLFVVQSSQNADTRAMQDKLDAILDAIPSAKTSVEGEEKDFKKGKKEA